MGEQNSEPEEDGPPPGWEDESVWGVPRFWIPKPKQDANPIDPKIAPKAHKSKANKDKQKKHGKQKPGT